MIYKNDIEQNTINVEFLTTKYEAINFLINKNQFVSVIQPININTIKSRLKYFNQTFKYENQIVPIININNYLIDKFNLKYDKFSNFTILSKLDLFNKNNKEKLLKFYKKNNAKKLSDDYIAVELNGNCQIITLTLDEFNLIPNSLNKTLNETGIIGIRFFNEKIIEYLIDLEKLIFNNEMYNIKKGINDK